MPTCFFIGHRDTSRTVLPHITKAAELLIQEEKVVEFYVGCYGSFDLLAGEAIISLKSAFPHVRLYLVIPYHPAERQIEVRPGFNGTVYPEGMEAVPRRYAISFANRKMIDRADYLVAYVTHTASNAHKLLDYAARREQKRLLHVINLGDKKDDAK